ncbi:MAG: hypothetical protein M1837_005993 [Sclerophora amabilis]|nr:MAG: hypothetical protein M1837_005993 [Sclerophora amabilis]
MALPLLQTPTFSLTIPSVFDDTVLDCRIYHPGSFFGDEEETRTATATNTVERWRKKGAVIAHPYAPLGGSYDDPVVASVAAEILGNGYVVGTFNFRFGGSLGGAGDSKGSTSWTAKAEVADYVSFAAFFIHYLHHLDPQPSQTNLHRPLHAAPNGTLTPIPSSVVPSGAPADDRGNTASVILGGYSYGSLIATYLPPVEAILGQFADVGEGSTEAEVVLRAERLAGQWNKESLLDIGSRRGRSSGTHPPRRSTSHSVVVGGEETEPGVRRPSRDSRRSMETIRKSLDFVRTSPSRRRHASKNHLPEEDPPGAKVDRKHLPTPDTYYLLISPLLPPISTFATFFSDLSHLARASPRSLAPKQGEKLVANPTGVVWGSRDGFTSHHKLRKWAESLAGKPQSRFRFWEIVGAGHFYHEAGADAQLRKHVRLWSQDIISHA